MGPMKNIDVVILCGGLGKRLRTVVKDRPKPMAKINQRPFLDILIEYVSGSGFKRFVLCTGYMGEKIREHYERGFHSLDIVFSREDKPLGTGGALRNAKSLLQSEHFLVMNGDSFCRVNFPAFIDFHLSKNALASIVLSRPKDDDNSGKIVLNKDGKIIDFEEKGSQKQDSYCSAGVYLMKQDIFMSMRDAQAFSLEYDVFPSLVKRGFYGYLAKEDFLDIGTPQNLTRAEFFLKKNNSAR